MELLGDYSNYPNHVVVCIRKLNPDTIYRYKVLPIRIQLQFKTKKVTINAINEHLAERFTMRANSKKCLYAK